MPIVRVNDIALYYELHGSGVPLVLIMGLAADISEYGWLIEALSRNNLVLAFDNRGAGRTEKPDLPYSVEMMATDTADLMRALDITKANILGISMGGRIALDLTLKHPDMVKNLILVSTSARVVKTWRRGIIFNFLPRLPILKGKYPQPYYAFNHQNNASSAYDCADQLTDISIPTFIMHGKKDKLVQGNLVQELQVGIKNSKLMAFQDGHMFFMFKERQRFLKAVEESLKSD